MLGPYNRRESLADNTCLCCSSPPPPFLVHILWSFISFYFLFFIFLVLDRGQSSKESSEREYEARSPQLSSFSLGVGTRSRYSLHARKPSPTKLLLVYLETWYKLSLVMAAVGYWVNVAL